MPARKGLLAPQNTFLDTIATRFDGTREYRHSSHPLYVVLIIGTHLPTQYYYYYFINHCDKLINTEATPN